MNPFEIHITRDIIDPSTIEGILDIFDKEEVEQVTHTDKGVFPVVIGKSN